MSRPVGRCAHQGGRCMPPTSPAPARILRRHAGRCARAHQFHLHRGGSAARIDHYQILVPDVRKATEFYMAAGFWLSESTSRRQAARCCVFLQRKGNPHDIVFFKEAGPRLHLRRLHGARDLQHPAPATSPARSAGAGVERDPAGTVQGTPCTSISAIRMGTGSNSSTPITRRWISRSPGPLGPGRWQASI